MEPEEKQSAVYEAMKRVRSLADGATSSIGGGYVDVGIARETSKNP